MDALQRDGFAQRWAKYFGDSRLPVALFFSDDSRYAEACQEASGQSCLIARMHPAWAGRTVVLTKESIGCSGGRCYSGFDITPRQGLAEFLSCGVAGRHEGLRYKKSPELVREGEANATYVLAAGRFLVFKRLDQVDADEQPEVVVFLATPDVLTALFHLAAFASSERDAVICPQGAACAQIINHPRKEAAREEPRAVLGMFDLSARPFVQRDELSFAVPWKRFVQMAEDMDASFLGTEGWRRIKGR